MLAEGKQHCACYFCLFPYTLESFGKVSVDVHAHTRPIMFLSANGTAAFHPVLAPHPVVCPRILADNRDKRNVHVCKILGLITYISPTVRENVRPTNSLALLLLGSDFSTLGTLEIKI